MTHVQQETPGLVFRRWARICSLQGVKAYIGTGTPLSEKSLAVIRMEHREGTVDSEAVHRHPNSRCPQELCMVCG